MKTIFLISFFALTFVKSYSQKIILKSLFFYQDSVFFGGCGVIKSVDILYFVCDTTATRNKESDYYIAISCPETYGKGFFKKGNKYSLEINKNYNEIKPYISPDAFEQFYRTERLYVLKKIRKL